VELWITAARFDGNVDHEPHVRAYRAKQDHNIS
jgi:hypothetical protein